MPEGRQALRQAFKRFEQEVPFWLGAGLRWLRHPASRWLRIPVGGLLVLGGVFSILPGLGIWMLPLGLLLLAADIPFLRKPVARFTLWGLINGLVFDNGSGGSDYSAFGAAARSRPPAQIRLLRVGRIRARRAHDVVV